MTREEAIEKLEAFAPMVVDDTREALEIAIEALQAEPVKHGEWIEEHLTSTKGETYSVARCSECGCAITALSHNSYCPNCGAKMDGGYDEK